MPPLLQTHTISRYKRQPRAVRRLPFNKKRTPSPTGMSGDSGLGKSQSNVACTQPFPVYLRGTSLFGAWDALTGFWLTSHFLHFWWRLWMVIMFAHIYSSLHVMSLCFWVSRPVFRSVFPALGGLGRAAHCNWLLCSSCLFLFRACTSCACVLCFTTVFVCLVLFFSCCVS